MPNPPSSDAFASASSQRGFTLIELLVTVAVLAVMLGLGASGLSRFVSNNKVFAASSALSSSLSLARNEAIRRGSVVYVTGLSSAAGAQFSPGWEVWVDEDGSGTRSAGDTLVRAYEALSPGLVAGGAASVAFTSRGSTLGAVSHLLTLRQIDTAAASAPGISRYTLIVAPTGFIEVQKVSGP